MRYSEFGGFTLIFQVKVELQVSGGGDELTGLTASFGSPFPTEAKKGFKYPAIFSNPLKSGFLFAFPGIFTLHLYQLLLLLLANGHIGLIEFLFLISFVL